MQPTRNSMADFSVRFGLGGKDTSNGPRRLWVLLTLMLAASFAVRVAAWAHWRTGAIESEGAEYARIAENLRQGVGYVGLATPGPELNFPPLFPLLIAGASVVTRDYEWAGRLIPFLLGALLPLPVFGVASRLFNRRVGIIAAMLAMIHPLLLNLSFTVFSEGPYATILLSAIYAVLRAINQSGIRWWLLVGGAFGLCYLLRAEATGAFALAVLFALAATDGSVAIRCQRAACAIAVFLAFASPEVIFIYRSSGKLRLEGKSAIFFYDARRVSAADAGPGGVAHPSLGWEDDEPSPEPDQASWLSWQEKWALYGIDSHLRGTGTAMRSFADTNRETRLAPKDLLLIAKGVRRNAPVMVRHLSSDWLGAPLLPALALLGALRRPWRRPKALGRLFVMLVSAVPVVANPFALMPSDPRYSFVLVPLLCVWAANGLFETGLWMKASADAARWRVLARPVISLWIVPGLIGLAAVIGTVKGVRGLGVFMEGAPSTRIDKEVGLWIGHQQNRPFRIMDLQIPLAFHAGAEFSHFPYCSGQMALRYLDAAKVDYVVLRRGQKFTRYYEEWLDHGVPDRRAELLRAPLGADAQFVLYRWHRAG